jgi:hypothetical protein
MNTKMKVLALALLGLAGYAGSAVAGCPSSPVPPWSSTTVNSGGTFNIVAGGLDGSACRADASLGANLGSIGSVSDTTPANEVRYRFQFMIDPSTSLTNFGGTDFVTVFRANAAAAANGTVNILTVSLVPGPNGVKRVRFNAACATGTNFRCAASDTTDLPAGASRIEGDLLVQASGATIRYWINAPAGTTEPAPTGTVSIDGGNADWVGVDTAIMGLSGPSGSFKNTHAGQAVGFDTFDSRRSTYIGS